ncbi:M16 family metallopeptidase [Saccharothrix hoggarensis]|uniref:M16 family metallopeptidase n=1 Tax=Saccharothrix hoggarensis TaxID=913853 RepID=A0ABW3R229_9PSEU
MEQTVVDGVPVYWAEGPAPMTATLAFGVGTRDESFRTIGVTHLIEHLAMSALPRVHYEHNASVELETTQFFATGKPAQLVEFLDVVCRALADLPLDRVEKEAGVLAAEGSQVTHPTAAALLARRFGTSGYGLAPWAGPGYDRIPAEAVAAHARRYFTKGNAVLTLTGPPPEGLRLALPDGERPARVAQEPLPADGPRWSAENVPCPGLSLTGPSASAPWNIAMLVLQERLTTTARREKGISYDVGGERADVSPETTERLIWLDAREGREAEVAEILWNTAQRLADDGPDQEEVDHELAAFAELIDDPRLVVARLDLRARAELLGGPYYTDEDWLVELKAVTPEQVAAVMAEGLRTALLVVPEGVALDLSDRDGAPVAVGGCARVIGPEPDGRVLRPPLAARVLNGAARRVRLILGTDGVTLRDDDGDLHTIRFADVVGVEVQDGARTVFGRHGCVIPVDPDLFRGAEAAVAALDAAVDPALRYRTSDLVSRDE